MSAVEIRGAAVPRTLVPGAFVPIRFSTRFFRSELALIFRRRRNLAGLGVLAAVPIIIAVAVFYSQPEPGEGPPFLSAVTGNGLFVTLVALTAELPLFLPLAVAAIAGDSVAGEAGGGTLRYLLTLPVSRTRLLFVKFAGIATFALAGTLLIAVVGGVAGALLFGTGDATLLSGSQVSFADAVGRLLLVCGYIALCMIALGAIGLFISTLTEQPIGATIAIVITAVATQILDAVPQLDFLDTFLFTHHWTAFGDLMRDPIGTSALVPGLIVNAVYTVLFFALAWARFAGRDVTS